MPQGPGQPLLESELVASLGYRVLYKNKEIKSRQDAYNTGCSLGGPSAVTGHTCPASVTCCSTSWFSVWHFFFPEIGLLCVTLTALFCRPG